MKSCGIGIAGGILAACAPKTQVYDHSVPSPDTPGMATVEPPEIPVPTFTSNPEPSKTPFLPEVPKLLTDTPFAEDTATPLPAEADHEDSNEVLTQRQKERLVETSLKYAAESEAEAIQIARRLKYLKDDGHPASVCGPLAIAILRDAGLISKYVDLHDFWLLNPRDPANLKILERVFPQDEFMWFKTNESIAEFDFKAFPLKTGDFLYLYAGDPGSFEHMLTVSRIDEEGRAFSVTNFDTPDGYVIQEVMLYDPTQPGKGKFYDWTNRKNYRYGLTGFGGFALWRFQTPISDPGPREQALARAIDDTIERHGGKWYVLIKEVSQVNLYAREIREPVHPASTIKVPIAMIFLNWFHSKNPHGFQEALKKGFDGRSYEQLLNAMLVDSEEKATESILKALKQARVNLDKTLKDWGTVSIDVEKRIASAHDMGILFEGLYGNFLSAEARQFILNALSVYTPGDDTRWGVVRKNLPAGYLFYNKRGTITENFLVVADCAIVECPTSTGKRVFLLEAFAFQGEQKARYEDLVAALEEIAREFWTYVQLL